MLSSCTQSTVKTESVSRWQSSESYTFNITKAVFESSDTSSSSTYTKYPLGTYEYDPAEKDELIPDDISGEYTMNLTPVDATQETYQLITTQTLYLRYKKSDLEKLGIALSDTNWSQYVPCDADNPFDKDDAYVVLQSTNNTTVTFKNIAAQTPISSTNILKGFYIGQSHNETNDLDLSTTYNWENNTATITDNKTNTSSDFSLSSSLIDANQLLLYLRSLDKSSDKFQDSPSVTVFSALTGNTYTASFSQFKYSCQTYVTYNGKDVAVILNLVGVSINGSTVLLQLNLPDTVNANGASIDLLQSGASNSISKYTTVRFRSGVINYELDNYSQEIIDAIKVESEE